MKYIDEFRDKELVRTLAEAIKRKSRRHIRIMEVCGGHTMAIRKYGIQKLLPDTIELLSGPGCPVCVTNRKAIDRAIELTKIKGLILATYGDLIRVPGSVSSLNREKALGADIRVVYSTMEAFDIARQNPDNHVVFPGIGFETTTPSSAIAILEAHRQDVKNFSVLSMHKMMPPAMEALIEQGVNIDGYIGPGHVTSVAGADMYLPLTEKFGVSVVVSGFEPVDLLQSVFMLVNMVEEGRHGVEVQYKRAVTHAGNLKAKEIVNEVFEPCDDEWRGLGLIPASGLSVQKKYDKFNAQILFNPEVPDVPEPPGCICGEVLRGIKKPIDCKLFRKLCTPANPIGSCMVSGEGACQAYYNYF